MKIDRGRQREIDIKILELLDKKPFDRDTMSMELGIPRTTIYDHLKKLERKGLVQKFKEIRSVGGRPKVYWVRKR